MNTPAQPTGTAPDTATPELALAAPVGSEPRHADGWLDRVWRLVVDFLPILMLALLALLTSWLVRSMPKEQISRPSPPANEPDYFMRDFTVREFNPQGVLRTELQGVFIDHLPANDTLRAQRMQSYSHDAATGVETRAWADRAVSDSKVHNAELFGNVKVIRTDSKPDGSGKPKPPIQFESDHLKLTNRQEHITTDKPVRITQGSDVMTGSGLDYTDASKVVQVQGRVNASIQPRP